MNNNVAVEIVSNVHRIFDASNGVPLAANTTTLFNLGPDTINMLGDPQGVLRPGLAALWFLTEIAATFGVNAFMMRSAKTGDPQVTGPISSTPYSSQLAGLLISGLLS